MTAATQDSCQLPHQELSALEQRRSHILDAFEQCIIKSGVHRTTMQDVAQQAGMSAGNLYRYFASKEALVSGLVGRDRRRFSADFQNVVDAQDVVSAFIALGRKHFVETPREHFVLYIEICAEAARNPAVREVCSACNSQIITHMVEVMQTAIKSGQAHPAVNCEATAMMICALGDGVFLRRAVDPDFDAEAAYHHMVDIMRAIFSGAVSLDTRPQGGGATGGQTLLDEGKNNASA